MTPSTSKSLAEKLSKKMSTQNKDKINCPLCNKTLSALSLVTHMAIVHGQGAAHECAECKQRFATKERFTSIWTNIDCKWQKTLPVKSATIKLQKVFIWTITYAPCILWLRRCIVAWRRVAWKFLSPGINLSDTRNYTKMSPVNSAINYLLQRGL